MEMYAASILFYFFKILFIFRQKGREGEREGQKQCVVASHVSPPGDLAHNPGMCPAWEWNGDPVVSMSACNPLSHTSQGSALS